MTCLTVTPATAQEAVEAAAGLIVSHHPVLFRASKRLTAGNPEGNNAAEPDPGRRRGLQSAHRL